MAEKTNMPLRLMKKDTNDNGQPVRKITKDAKSIIIFQSLFGSTKLLASKIVPKTDAGILENILRTHYLVTIVKH